MRINVKADHLDRLIQLYQRYPEVAARNLLLAVQTAVKDVRNRAQSVHRFVYRTGRLERAIRSEVYRREGKFGGRVYLNDGQAGAPYGRYLHEGTGLYGPKHQEFIITPKTKKLLRWVDAKTNRFVAAKLVKNPGVKPDPFVTDAGVAMEPKVQDVFRRYALRAAREAGLQ